MQSIASRYPDWKAPPADGQVLIWPEPARLLDDTRDNHTRLSSLDTPIQNIPLREVRTRTRAFIGHDTNAPLLATGHQTELFHPGVWVKDALIHVAAQQLSGEAYHLAVDTDAPKHLQLKWPGGSMPISDDPNLTSASWSGQLASPTPAHLREIDTQFTSVSDSWSFNPILPDLLISMRRLALETPNLSKSLTNALHEVDWSLGLRNHALTVSPIWQCEPFLLFAHDLIARGEQLARDYNCSLAEYRSEYDVRTNTRPMPDLFVSDESIEVPFWLDDLGSGKRVRPTVFRAPDNSWLLHLLNGDEFIFDSKLEGWEAAARLARWLRSTNLRLAPRALTLTVFFRLFLADQWTHGIGGGRYDQVADRLIERHFKIEAPRFSVTTATMYFPDAVGRQRVCLPCVEHEGHRLRHAALGERKLSLVRRIESLPRHSHERATAFLAMHNELEAATAASPKIARWRELLEHTKSAQREEASIFDRELFYGIQSRERLAEMIDRYSRAFDGK